MLIVYSDLLRFQHKEKKKSKALLNLRARKYKIIKGGWVQNHCAQKRLKGSWDGQETSKHSFLSFFEEEGEKKKVNGLLSARQLYVSHSQS